MPSISRLLLIPILVCCLAANTLALDTSVTVSNVNGVDIAWAERGDPEGPPVLLISGLMCSHQIWGQDFITELENKGYRLILFDNRDVGDSSRMDHLGEPVLWWNLAKARFGFQVNAPYTLFDMAKDASGLLELLNIEEAHVLGASMGGMIAQILAARHPDKVRSLISVMSTTGAPHLPPAQSDATSRMQSVAETGADDIERLNRRGLFPSAFRRHLMAVLSSGDRSSLVRSIEADTLVIHGEDDGLLPLAHGQHTAELIEGSTFLAVDGMAHNLPADRVSLVVEAMDKHMLAVENRLRISESAQRDSQSAY